MDEEKLEYEELVTVEVLPQTVNDVVYMTEDVITNESTYLDEEADESSELYEIGTVDAARLMHMPLVLDESQSFVFLSQGVDSNVQFTIQSDPNPKPYVCSVCNFASHTLNELNSHRTIHTNLPKETFVCKVCSCPFEKAQALSLHFKTLHQSPKLICNICGCPCATESALMCHYKKHEPKAFSCDVCNAEYDNAVALNNHIKTHGTALLYACNKCDAEFASTAQVSCHLRTFHGNERKHALPISSPKEKSDSKLCAKQNKRRKR